MARNKRKIENGLKNEVEAKKEEVIEDKDTKIGKNEKAVEVESEEDDGDSSDSSVYSELEEGKYLRVKHISRYSVNLFLCHCRRR